MIQEMKHLFQNHSLTEDLVVILQEFPFPRKLAYRILHALNGNLFHDIIDSALKMEFMGNFPSTAVYFLLYKT